MSLIIVDPRSRVPIYEQLVGRIKELIYTGELQADASLPSVRSLASELAINPNTIQRAYTALEAEGVIYSLPARGSFVAPDTGALIGVRKQELQKRLSEVVADMKRLGVGREEILSIMEEVMANDQN